MRAGESLPETRIAITVDGTPTVINVRTTLAASPSPWPAVLGALLGLALAAAALLPVVPAAAAVLPIALAATWVGVVQYTSLPSETGPRLVWWLPAALAVVCGVAAMLTPLRAVYLRTGLTLVAAVQLVVWGFARRDGLTHAVLPTSAPFWLDRLVTASALAGGAALLAIAVYELARSLRLPAAAPVTAPTPQP
jgi:hypothetical protein